MRKPEFVVKDLPSDVFEKARIELNECPEAISDALYQFKEMIASKKGLNGCLEDAFLLRFLRARKHNLDKAFTLYVNYYAVRLQFPDVFNDLRPTAALHLFLNGVVCLLPNATAGGERVLLFRPGIWEPAEWPSSDLFRANVLLVEDLLQNHQEVQIHGLVVLVTLVGFGWKHAFQLASLDFARRAARFIQDTTPIRVKAVHVVNEPNMFSRVFSLIQPLLKPKHQRRIIFHGNSLESLHNHLSPELLPSNIGLQGTGPPVPSLDYCTHLQSMEDYFIYMNRFSISHDLLSRSVDVDHLIVNISGGAGGSLQHQFRGLVSRSSNNILGTGGTTSRRPSRDDFSLNHSKSASRLPLPSPTSVAGAPGGFNRVVDEIVPVRARPVSLNKLHRSVSSASDRGYY